MQETNPLDKKQRYTKRKLEQCNFKEKENLEGDEKISHE